jgi:hypothetical protein
MKWAGHIAHMGKMRCAYRIFLGKLEGRSPLGRPRSRWKDNIKMDLQEIVWEVGTGHVCVRIGTGGGFL